MSSSPEFYALAASRNATDSSAIEQLTATVDRLVRAERRQALTHYGLAGLFWGITAACLAVLIIRLWPLPVSIVHALFSCILLGLIVGLTIGWANRRSPLAVAILADIRLNLKQRLSSAWELYESDQRSANAAGIAQQLLKIRTPIAERAFPLSQKSGNAEYRHPGVRWGRLVPAAALMLLLLNTLNLQQLAGRSGSPLDSAVQSEGTTLRTYGASLALRARNDNLQASTRMAESMRQLGRRMEGGTLAREPALERLNELRRDISNARQGMVPRNGNNEAVNESEHNRARSIIENAVSELTNGDVSPNELRDDNSLKNALATANINAEAFRQAVEEAHNGDPQSLEKMMQALRDDGHAARDAQELERAYERVQSIRENLGAQPEPESTVPSGNDRGSNTENEFTEQQPDLSQSDKGESPGIVFHNSAHPGGLSQTPDVTQNDKPAVEPEGDQPSVRPAGKIGEGRDVVTQTRIAARHREVTTALQTSNPQQQQKLEAILAKESLPAHQKAYVRRYFLELSRAVNAAPAATGESPVTETEVGEPTVNQPAADEPSD